MEKFFVVLGNGKSQLPIINRLLKTKQKVLVIDRILKTKKKIKFFKSSIYDFNKKKIYKYFKNINIIDIIYGSSGPSILLYNYLSRLKLNNKVNLTLARSIYSKSFLEKILILKRVQNYPPKNMLSENEFIIKPDAPIEGKKYVYLSANKKINLYRNKILSPKISHNRKIFVQKKMNGSDITFLFFKKYKNKKITPILRLQEFNKFDQNNSLKHLAICSPPLIKISNKLNQKIHNTLKKMNFLIKNYYGLFSISMKIHKNDFFIYEMNVGLLGDKICEKFLPNFYQNNFYDNEIYNKSSSFRFIKKNKNKFLAYCNQIKLINKKKFMIKLKTYET